MTSQTRLDSQQTEILELMREYITGVSVFHFPTVGTGICVIIKQTGIDTAKFAVSIASCEERVYRYDVAEYVAFTRWDNEMVMPCNIYHSGFETPINTLGKKAYDIACALG